MKVPDVPVAPLPPLRDYQRDLLQAAAQNDAIVYLETGMGKTRIALELIAGELQALRSAGQVAVFLAPTVPLVRQQAEVLARVPDTVLAGGKGGGGGSGPVKDLRKLGGPQPNSNPDPNAGPRGDTAMDVELMAGGGGAAPADTTSVGAAAAALAAGSGAAAGPAAAAAAPRRKRAKAPSSDASGAPTSAATAAAPAAGASAKPARSALLKVACLGGDSALGSWGPQRWSELLQRVDVLVCTPAVLLGALVHALIKLSDIGLIVVDEAHHCREQHPYAVLMREFINRDAPPPAGGGGSAAAATAITSTDASASGCSSTASAVADANGTHTIGVGVNAVGVNPRLLDTGTGTRPSGGSAAAAAAGGRCGGVSGPLTRPPSRPRILGLTASPLTPMNLQSSMGGGRLITPLDRGQMDSNPPRPKAKIIWVGPGEPLPSPPGAEAPIKAPTPLDPHAVLKEHQAAFEAAAAQSAQLRSALSFSHAVLQLTEQVLSSCDRLQRLHQLGELSLEQLGLAGGTVPPAVQSAVLGVNGRGEYDASLRDIVLLKSQVLALQCALQELGPWPAMALAAAAIFSSSSAAATAAAASSEQQQAAKSVDQLADEDLRKVLEPTDLGPPPSADLGRELIADMLELQQSLDSVVLPRLPGRGPPNLGQRVASAVLLLIMEGFLVLLAPQDRQGDAARIAKGFGADLLARGGWTASRRDLLTPWARELLRLIPAEVLQEQVLGVGAGPASVRPWPLQLVTHRLCWLMRQLHLRAYEVTSQEAQQQQEQQQQQPRAAAGSGSAAGGRGSKPVWSAMVFCERKSTCEALDRLIAALPALRGLLRAGVFTGSAGMAATSNAARRKGSSQKRQELVRQEFSSGQLNLLLSTSVGAEGLDFSHCALVVALDLPKHVTPFVQSGGRARAPGSEHWLMVSTPEEEAAAMKLLQAEQMMLMQAQSLATANFQALGGQSSDAGWMGGAAPDGDAAGGQGTGPAGEGAGPPLLEPGDDVALEVPATGARLPAVWAVDLLQQVCCQLPGNEGCTVLQPLFRWQSQGPGAHDPGFSYRVFLPANLNMEPVDGPQCSTKSLAKKLACLEAVRRLWQRGDLDDHLRLKYNRRAATRAAHAAAFGGFLYSIPQATLPHRLPETLRPGGCRPPPTSVPTSPVTTYHLYIFVVRPKVCRRGWASSTSGVSGSGSGSTAANGAGAGGGAAGGNSPPGSLPSGLLPWPAKLDALFQNTDYGPEDTENRSPGEAAPVPAGALCWGALLHGTLPAVLPAFDLFLPDGDKSEVAVQARALYVGPLPAGPRTHAVLGALGRVLARLVTCPCPAAAVRAAAAALSIAAGKALPARRAGPADHDAWADWVGFRRLDAALQQLLDKHGHGAPCSSTRAPGAASAPGAGQDDPMDTAADGGGGGSGARRPTDGVEKEEEPKEEEEEEEEPASGPGGCWWTPIPIQLSLPKEAFSCGGPEAEAPGDQQGDVAMGESPAAAVTAAGAAGEDRGGGGGGGTEGGDWHDRAAEAEYDARRLEDAASEECGDAAALWCIDWATVRRLATVPRTVVEAPPPPPAETTADAAGTAGPAAEVTATAASEAAASSSVGGASPPAAQVDPRVVNLVSRHGLLLSHNSYRMCGVRFASVGAKGPDGGLASGGARDDSDCTGAGPSSSNGPQGAAGSGSGSGSGSGGSTNQELIVLELAGYGKGRADWIRSRNEGVVATNGGSSGGNGKDGSGGGDADGATLGDGGARMVSPKRPRPKTPEPRTYGNGTARDEGAEVVPCGSSPRPRSKRTLCVRPDVVEASVEAMSIDDPPTTTPEGPAGREPVLERDTAVAADMDAAANGDGDDGGGAAATAAGPSADGTVKGRGKRTFFREMTVFQSSRAALYPLDLWQWRTLQGLPAIMWRLEGLTAASDYMHEKLQPARFEPACREPVTARRLLLTATALTSTAARDPTFNNDRLEFLGDAVLKLLAHAYVFLRERNVVTSHEGVLSFMRDALVANEVLATHALGPRLDLAPVLRALPFEPSRAIRQARLAPDEADDGTPLRRVPWGGWTVVAGAAAMFAAGTTTKGGGDGGGVAGGDPAPTVGSAAGAGGPAGTAAAADAAAADAAAADAAQPAAAAQPPAAGQPAGAGGPGAKAVAGRGKRQTARPPKQKPTMITRVLTGVNGKRLADCVEALIGAHLMPSLEAEREKVVAATRERGGGGGGSGGGAGTEDGAADLRVSRGMLTCSASVQAAIGSALNFCVGVGLLPDSCPAVIRNGMKEVAPAFSGPPSDIAGGVGAGTEVYGVTADATGSRRRVGGEVSTVRQQQLNGMSDALRGSVLAVENILGHKFHHPNLCVQAITHVSHSMASKCGGGYQRVEFLGDGVLGMVASLWAFWEGGTAEAMTQRRMALVSNGPLAAAAVRRGLQQHLRSGSSSLLVAINHFAASYEAAVALRGSEAAVAVTTAERLAKNKRTERKDAKKAQQQQQRQGKAQQSQTKQQKLQPVKRSGHENQDALRAPKALADIVEALVGAVYLDTWGDLKATERAVANIMLQ